MLDFQYVNKTKIFFGKNALENITQEIVGSKILLLIGSGSIKKIGLYEEVKNKLKNFEVFELEGVKPNPRVDLVYKGIKICKENKIDMIIAVGGGSVADSAKAIAAGSVTEYDIWDYFQGKRVIENALPIGVVLTLAATGTEMNGNTVISNLDTTEKIGLGSEYLYPKFSILNPEYTKSVPLSHSIYGCVDIMSHVFEQYFTLTEDTPLQDRLCESVLITVVENAYKLIEDPTDYISRANIMWCGTVALNQFIAQGKGGDWASHNIEHELSANYDISHGAGLAIVHPNWMKYVMKNNVKLFKQYAQRVWNVESDGKTDEEIALLGITKTKQFFKDIGAPTKLSDVGIGNEKFDIMSNQAVRFGKIGSVKVLDSQAVKEILELCLKD